MAHVVEKSKEKQFTLAEVAEHASDKSRFIVINDNVYDVTKFIDEVQKIEHIFISLNLFVAPWWRGNFERI